MLITNEMRADIEQEFNGLRDRLIRHIESLDEVPEGGITAKITISKKAFEDTIKTEVK
jgi:hypothetical protein